MQKKRSVGGTGGGRGKKQQQHTSRKTSQQQKQQQRQQRQLQQKKKKEEEASTTIVPDEEDREGDNTGEGRMGRRNTVTIIGLLLAVVVGGIAVATPIFHLNKETTVREGEEKTTELSSSFSSPSSRSSNQDADDVGGGSRREIFTEVLPYELLGMVEHDPQAFTQGLTFPWRWDDDDEDGDDDNNDDGGKIVFESTGIYGSSEVRKVNISSGKVLQRAKMNPKHFGEGMAYFPSEGIGDGSGAGVGRLILLTWQEKIGFVYDPKTLRVLDEFSFQTTTSQGWGITYDTQRDRFIVSDGSEYLHFWDRETYKEIRSPVAVHYRTAHMQTSKPMGRINELEWDHTTNTLLGNIWYQNIVVRIDPETGFVSTIYNFQSLYTHRTDKADSFNGIAIRRVRRRNINDDDGDVLWVTGKWWPHMYQVRIPKYKVT